MFIPESRGFVGYSRKNLIDRAIGGSVKPIVQHRHQRDMHHDPNVEILRESLHKLMIGNSTGLRGAAAVSAHRAASRGSGSLPKKSKYIVF